MSSYFKIIFLVLTNQKKCDIMQLENQDLRNQKYIVEVVNDMKVFIGGSKNISEPDSKTRYVLDRLCTEKAGILIGDFFGADIS